MSSSLSNCSFHFSSANPCLDPEYCGENAECNAMACNAKKVGCCTCPKGYFGDPYYKCTRPETSEVTCNVDEHCPTTSICVNTKCVDACDNCVENSYCSATNHEFFCTCREGYSGDPYGGVGCSLSK